MLGRQIGQQHGTKAVTRATLSILEQKQKQGSGCGPLKIGEGFRNIEEVHRKKLWALEIAEGSTGQEIVLMKEEEVFLLLFFVSVWL